jgi:lipoteichoic acid synthase
VIFKNRSWITDKGKYNAVTQIFISKDGAEVSDEYVEWMNAIVESKFFYSQKVLETDYYRKVLGDYETEE